MDLSVLVPALVFYILYQCPPGVRTSNSANVWCIQYYTLLPTVDSWIYQFSIVFTCWHLCIHYTSFNQCHSLINYAIHYLHPFTQIITRHYSKSNAIFITHYYSTITLRVLCWCSCHPSQPQKLADPATDSETRPGSAWHTSWQNLDSTNLGAMALMMVHWWKP